MTDAKSDKETAGAAIMRAEAADLLDKVGKAGLWGLAAAGGDPAGFALGVAKGGFHWVWDRTREWYSASLGKELEENAQELNEGVDGLIQRGLAPHEVGIDFNALLRAWAKASERSVGRKKRILMAALQHSLRADPEEYRRGLGLQILEVLEELDYGDVLILRRAVEDEDRVWALVPREGLADHHLRRLQERHLVERTDHHTRASKQNAFAARATPFGRKVLEYTRDGLACSVADEEREVKE